MQDKKIVIALGIAAVVFMGLSVLVGGLAMVRAHHSPSSLMWQRGYAPRGVGPAEADCPRRDGADVESCEGYGGGAHGHMGHDHDDDGAMWRHEDCPFDDHGHQDELPGRPGEGYGPGRGLPGNEEGAPGPGWHEGMPGPGGMMGPRFQQDGR